jgi:hypothetical protein
MVFIIKWIVAWTMQLTGSIALAMMIPVAMLLASTFFLYVLKEDQEIKS